MWVIGLCVVMVLAGLLAVTRWGGMAVQPPPTPAGSEPGPDGRLPVGLVVRRYLWYLTLAVSAGAAAGLLAAGAGGAAFGALLLVLAGTRLEPLRPGNPDFDLVGPGWVSVVAFAALVLFHGMLVAALAGRLSRSVPLLGPTLPAVAAHLPLLLLALGSVALVAAAVGAVAVLASQVPAVVAAWHDQRALMAGRVVLGLVALVALPSFIVAVAGILGRP
jgi:hypothetical protein